LMFVWNYKAIQKTKFCFVVSNRIFQAKAYTIQSPGGSRVVTPP